MFVYSNRNHLNCHFLTGVTNISTVLTQTRGTFVLPNIKMIKVILKITEICAGAVYLHNIKTQVRVGTEKS
jgi:hypothetical protein